MVDYHQLNQIEITITEMILDVVTNKYKMSSTWYLDFNRGGPFYLYFKK